jgi:hypothetical protein
MGAAGKAVYERCPSPSLSTLWPYTGGSDLNAEEIRALAIERLAEYIYGSGTGGYWDRVNGEVRAQVRADAARYVDAIGDLLPTQAQFQYRASHEFDGQPSQWSGVLGDVQMYVGDLRKNGIDAVVESRMAATVFTAWKEVTND